MLQNVRAAPAVLALAVGHRGCAQRSSLGQRWRGDANREEKPRGAEEEERKTLSVEPSLGTCDLLASLVMD